MSYLFYLFIFIFGSAIGSFLNVVICRLETGEDIAVKRSHCVKCGQVLAWYDLIPVISFFILRGRCRACRERISWQYPAVEIMTGLLFVLAAQHFVILSVSEGSSVLGSRFFAEFMLSGANVLRMTDYTSLFYYWFIFSSLIVIFVYDLRHYIIPDVVLWPAIGAAAAYRIFDAFANFNPPTPLLEGGQITLMPPLLKGGAEGLDNLIPFILSALVASAFFLFLVLATRGRGMGRGDVKLAFLMGLVLGWPNILLALFLAFCLGALVGVGLIVAGKKTMKSQIPFGPFLILGTMAALFFGEALANLVLWTTFL